MFEALKYTVLAFALCASWSGRAQSSSVEYSIDYGGTSYEELFDMEALPDGGFIAVGQTGSDINGSLEQTPPTEFGFNTDLLAIRFDASGNRVWEVRLGGALFDQARAVAVDADGNFIISGNSDSEVSSGKSDPPLGGMDLWLVKLAPDGSRIYDKTFGTPNSEFASGVEVMSNGNYLISASSKTSPSTEFDTATSRELDYYILEVSNDGELVRERYFGGEVYDRSWGMIKLANDRGFMIFGGSASSASETKALGRFGKSDAWIVHLDANGSLVRDYQFGGPSTEQARGLVEYDNGDILLLSESANTGAGPPVAQEPPNRDPTTAGFIDPRPDSRDAYVVRFALGPGPDIDVKWQTVHGGQFGDDVKSGVPSGKECMTLVGSTSSEIRNGSFTNGPIDGGVDAWIYQIDGNGKVVWDESHGGNGGDKLEFIFKGARGGFLLGGLTGSTSFDWKSEEGYGDPIAAGSDQKRNDLWFVKLACDYNVRLIDDEYICATETFELVNLDDPNPSECTTFRWLDANGNELSQDPSYTITVPDLTSTTVAYEGLSPDGCRSSDVVTITNTAGLDFLADPVVEDELCENSFGAVTVELTDAVGEFEIDGIRYPSGQRVELVPGSYTVTTVEDVSCQESRTFTIGPSTNGVAAPEFDLVTEQGSKCAGSPVRLSIKDGFNAPSGADYLWTQNNGKEVLGADAELAIAPIKATTVSLRVVDLSSGCAGKDSIAIEIDPSPAIIDYSVTGGPCSTTGGATSLYVELFPQDTPFELNGQSYTTSPQTIPVQPGQYRLTTSAAPGQCGIDTTIQFTKDAPFQVDLGPDLNLCEGDLVELRNLTTDLPGDVELTIVDEQGVIVGPDGTYTEPALDSKTFVLIGTAPNGCESQAVVQLTVGAQPEAPELITVDASCGNTPDGALQVNSFDGLAYVFGGVEYTDLEIFTDLIAGTYTITSVADVSACNRIDSFDITGENDFFLDLGEDVLVSTGSELTLNADASVPITDYRWYGDVFADSLEIDGPTATFQVIRSGEVFVEATNEEGCTRVASVSVEGKANRRVAIPTAFSPNGDGNNEVFTIYTTPFVAEVGPLRIYDRWGTELFVGTDQGVENPQGWDGRRQSDGYPVSTGVYVYTVDVKFLDGTSRIYQGEVTLMR